MRVLIISGGYIDDVFALEWMKKNEYDCIIAADSGMNFLYRNRIVPDIIAGDFDSVDDDSLDEFSSLSNVEMLRLNPIKDDTDTEFVIREAIRRGAKEITILGATGTRLDHVLANVHLLGIGLEEGVSMELVDANNRIRMIADTLEILKTEQFGDFVSILPIKGDAKGVTLQGMKYSLCDADVSCFSSLGVSNEIVGEKAKILVRQGTLLVIESRD
ncbi:MAG: thiamine diphosphokinase [Agathobacter sp.]|nr:thiamine diphosphokinase [Agathobacter sp.]